MLAVEDVHAYYDLSHVLQGVSLEVRDGEIVALIGRNGAGKSTTLKSIMGIVPPRRGRIRLDGVELQGLPTHAIARRGIAYVPEERRIFAGLSVAENLRLAMLSSRRLNQSEALDRVYSYFPRLAERRRQDGKSLSGGEQQMLAMARALIANPRIILVDEPTQGLAPQFVRGISDILVKIRADGVATLLVEQNAKVALEITDRAYVIDHGLIQYAGTSAEVQANERIQREFLAV